MLTAVWSGPVSSVGMNPCQTVCAWWNVASVSLLWRNGTSWYVLTWSMSVPRACKQKRIQFIRSICLKIACGERLLTAETMVGMLAKRRPAVLLTKLATLL